MILGFGSVWLSYSISMFSKIHLCCLCPHYLFFKGLIFNCTFSLHTFIFSLSIQQWTCELLLIKWTLNVFTSFWETSHLTEELQATDLSPHRLSYPAALANDWQLTSWAWLLVLSQSSVVLILNSDCYLSSSVLLNLFRVPFSFLGLP